MPLPKFSEEDVKEFKKAQKEAEKNIALANKQQDIERLNATILSRLSQPALGYSSCSLHLCQMPTFLGPL